MFYSGMRINNIAAFGFLPKLNITNQETLPILSEIKDTVTFSGNTDIHYIDESTPLLDGYTKKPMKGFDDLSPSKMCLVHMTNYFPYDGEIKSTDIATKDENGKRKNRFTVHFAINHSVKEHNFFAAEWQHMKYAIILPMDGVFEQTEKGDLLGGTLKDFYIKGRVKIPDNSVIVKYNPNMQDGRLKVTNASETMEDFRGTKGIKIIETPNPHTGKIADNIVSKMGYTNLDDLAQKCSGLSEEEYAILSDEKYSEYLKNIDLTRWSKIKHNIDSRKVIKLRNIVEINWGNFTKKYNLTDKNHINSPWARSENLIESIKLAAVYDSWTGEFLKATATSMKEDEIKELKELCNKASEYSFAELREIFIDMSDEELMDIFEIDNITEDTLQAILKDSCPVQNIDYKQEFLKIINEIKESLPKEKTLGFDIDILKEIIEEAETPSKALKEIENRLNLEPKTIFDTAGEELPESFEFFSLIDALVGITNKRKQAIRFNGGAALV